MDLPGIIAANVAIQLPVSASQAKRMVQEATECLVTVDDELVLLNGAQVGHEIGLIISNFHDTVSEKVIFRNENFISSIKDLASSCCQKLYDMDAACKYRFDKMVIYEPGDSFPPRNSLGLTQESGFGQLVLFLPSECIGGTIIVTSPSNPNDSIEYLHPGDEYEWSYVAWALYSKIEMEPIESGYKIGLVFSLMDVSDDFEGGETSVEPTDEFVDLGGKVDVCTSNDLFADEDYEVEGDEGASYAFKLMDTPDPSLSQVDFLCTLRASMEDYIISKRQTFCKRLDQHCLDTESTIHPRHLKGRDAAIFSSLFLFSRTLGYHVALAGIKVSGDLVISDDVTWESTMWYHWCSSPHLPEQAFPSIHTSQLQNWPNFETDLAYEFVYEDNHRPGGWVECDEMHKTWHSYLIVCFPVARRSQSPSNARKGKRGGGSLDEASTAPKRSNLAR